MESHNGFPPISKEDIQRVFGSPEGQALIRLLSRDGGGDLKRAAEAVKQGKPEIAKELMRAKMESPDATALIEKLQQK